MAATGAPSRRRRHPEEVVGSAVLVGLASAIPLALLVLLVPGVVEARVGGAGWSEALALLWITDSEDWEMMPLFLAAALTVGALVGAVAGGAWCVLSARRPGRPWVADLGAALVAAGVALLVLGWASWSAAVPAAVGAALVALAAAPRVGFAPAHGTASTRTARTNTVDKP